MYMRRRCRKNVLFRLTSTAAPVRFCHTAPLLVGCRIEKDLSHLDLALSGGDAFACPCHCRIHVGAFQNPKTADVLLGLKVRPVGDEDSAIGLPSLSPGTQSSEFGGNIMLSAGSR